MAKIPTYERKVSLTTQAPATHIPQGTIGQQYKGLEAIGQAISNIGKRMHRVRQEEEMGRASVEAQKQISAIEWEAFKDSEVIGYDEKYEKKLNDLREASINNIKDAEVRAKFSRRLDLDLTNSKFKIKQYGYRKLIDQRFATLNEQIAKERELYVNESNFNLKQQHLDKISSLLNTAVEQGVMTRTDAQKSYANIKAELPEQQAEWDILQNPQFALAELQKGEQGAYRGLPLDKRVSLINTANTRIEKLRNQEAERIAIAMNQREAELIDMKIAGTLEEGLIKQEREAENISARFANSMINALRNPKRIGAKTDATTFNKLSLDILDSTKNPEEIRVDLLNNNAIGKLSDEDMAMLYIFNQGRTKDVLERNLPKKSFLQKISFWSDEYAQERDLIKAQMFKEYMRRVNKGESPDEAFMKVIGIHKKKSIYEIGQIISTPKGNVKIVGFDADGEEIIEVMQ